MTEQNQDALRCAEFLKSAVCEYPQMSEDEPGDYATEVDQEMDFAAELRRLHAEVEAQRILLQKSVEAWDSDEIDTDPVAAVIEAIRQHLKGATQ